ncbi:dehydrogenase/reductase SDR family member 12 isoform X2 [Folsomia candida]|uniref:dehydrogenase/reductase SDR family member 12 isoform X2 n=1 Tax=Folsomia candida TaxID=158441 RepID=UPI0016052BD8|nr:dehydrogenase/reductase SDR family member 12 isoform X2 [Folsomia candida]
MHWDYWRMSIYRNTIFYIKGLREFTKSGYEIASKNFNPHELDVDCSLKHFIITGANSGLGYSTALEIAKKNGTVHMVCRNAVSGEQAKHAIVKESKNSNVHLHIVDLSKPKDVVKFAKRFAHAHSRLDVLINNAGCLLNERVRTEDGLDANFATNTLGYYLMTREMLGLLSKSEDPRVLMVSSGGMYTQKLDHEDFNFDRWRKYDGVIVYAQNKRQQVVMCEEFAKSHPNIFFASMHPGWANTPGVRKSIPDFYERHKSQLRTPQEGSDTLVWLAVAPAKVIQKFGSGNFFQDRAVCSTHLPLAWTKSSEADNSEFMKKLSKIADKFL